jgi:hypothetical protein
MASDKLWVAGVELAQPASLRRRPRFRGRRPAVADPSHPALSPVFEPGQNTQNATNEPKIAENAVVAEGEAKAKVAAKLSPSPGLDKRANEPEKQGALQTSNVASCTTKRKRRIPRRSLPMSDSSEPGGSVDWGVVRAVRGRRDRRD